MYVNQIDNIIDTMLDKLYLEGLRQPNPFSTIIDTKQVNFAEYQDPINQFIKSFTDSINIIPIQKLINNKENLQRIINIIKRYVAYYCFLYMAYYYAGTAKDFRNNLIQISKLQESSTSHIKNFFDTENNYQLIIFFRIINDSKKILLMTPLQRQTLQVADVKDAVDFLNTLDADYIDNYILAVTTDEFNEQIVDINVHNLIKTIVFREIYKNQEQYLVFKILSDIEEKENEYIWIDIVVSTDELTDFNFFRNIFAGEDDYDFLARELFELVIKSGGTDKIRLSKDKKNNNLIQLGYVSPIVDDFLRYHKDTEKLDTEHDNTFVLSHFNKNNSKNVQLALIRQHKKKKENTKARLIINKVDMITDLYSENVKTNPEIQKEIKKFFYGPLSYRKAVLHNYLDEIYVMRKMLLQGKKIIDLDEYYLELKAINTHAYFNFKDFQKYGTSLTLDIPRPINVIRNCNIEFIGQFPTHDLDVRSAISDSIINMTGLTIGPIPQLGKIPLQCAHREDLVDIRTINIIYETKNGLKELKTENGYDAYTKILDRYYIKTITLKTNPTIDLYNDFSPIHKINPAITNKIIYWIYDIIKDKYVIETYENTKAYDFQENIKFMNAKIFDVCMGLLYKQLVHIITTHNNLPLFEIEKIIYIFIKKYNLVITQIEISELIVREYLTKKPQSNSLIIPTTELDRLELPVYDIEKLYIPKPIYQVEVDMINPLHLQEWTSKLESYLIENNLAPTPPSYSPLKIDAHCRHEAEWAALSKLRRINLNEYNMAVTQFINKYAVETSELYYVCRLCSQFLPMKEFYQDGKFNNSTQKYTTNYVPTNIPLNEIKEYTKYTRTINHIAGLLKKMTEITGMDMFAESKIAGELKRKTMIKNVIDIINTHTSNLSKGEFDVKLYGINPNISSVFYFELSDNIFVAGSGSGPSEIDINRLKINNIVLYLIWIFITELNPVQILSMITAKLSNIYIVEEYSSKIFGGLLLKKNINGTEKVPIIEYPVLCYILYLISYSLIRYGVWHSVDKSSKTFNAFIVKGIINSLVELFNGFSINYNKMPSDYVYSLVTGKIYTQLNDTFKNTDIIRLLKDKQKKYSNKLEPEVNNKPSKTKVPHFKSISPCRRFTYRVGPGIMRYDIIHLSWNYIPINTNLTNCPTGDFHQWIVKQTSIICAKCGTTYGEIHLDNLIDRTTESYYFNLTKIAIRKCLDCNAHNFTKKDEEIMCTLCNKSKTDTYTHAELNKLNANLKSADDAKYDEIHKKELELEAHINLIEEKSLDIMADLVTSSSEPINPVFIDRLEQLLGKNTNFGTSSYPMYLRDDVYIINHTYTGLKIDNPITFTESENRIMFKENHTFFNTDVFFYVNNEVGSVDVFYHAVTMKLIGYKEKHKEYIIIKNSNDYLIINRSIKNKLLNLGHKNRYIDISTQRSSMIKQMVQTHTTIDENFIYYNILDSLIKNHIFTVRQIVNKICSVLSKIRNWDKQPTPTYLMTKIDLLIVKYAELVPNFRLGPNDTIFDTWNFIQDEFTFVKPNWIKTNIRPTKNNQFVNSDIINQYCPQKDLMLDYLVKRLTIILEEDNDKKSKYNIANLYIELINYIFELYNRDTVERIPDVKRFEYILDGSTFMIDLLKKGRGLIHKELEEEIGPDTSVMGEIEIPLTEESRNEIEENIEASEALDVETNYYEDETEDYNEATGSEE